jgi:Domain of unknown function (DUF1918)
LPGRPGGATCNQGVIAMTKGKAGDNIVVESEQVGQPSREGEIVEVIEGAVSVRYRVRWTDGHESIFTPGGGAARIRAKKKKSKR